MSLALAATVLPLGTAQAQSSSAQGGGSISEVPENPGPEQSTHAAAAAYARTHPGAAPPGSNDFSCKPSAAHPRPVILAHGTDASAYSDWSAISPALKAAGYCVFALNYGGKPGGDAFGTEDMRVSGEQTADFVQRVRTATGAEKVDLIGFSQGATVTRYFVNRLGGAAVVDRWIGVASPSYGGVFYGLAPVVDGIPGGAEAIEAVLGQAVGQQIQGSPFLDALNLPEDTVPGVRYTTIGTRYDEMIQPASNVALRGEGATNISIQDLCPQDQTGHMNMVYDPFTIGVVLRALDPAAPEPRCVPVPLGTGIPGMVLESNFGGGSSDGS
ncbi:esterase/lipase family protein [Rhodococcus sp. NPDC058514]|uniref:esterase/lipase family protein n=1 Tax=unclassified Rhodococcus (in: high G+C Gram-positive bacteria) TaxID=192944 RepID=UPI0036500839